MNSSTASEGGSSDKALQSPAVLPKAGATPMLVMIAFLGMATAFMWQTASLTARIKECTEELRTRLHESEQNYGEANATMRADLSSDMESQVKPIQTLLSEKLTRLTRDLAEGATAAGNSASVDVRRTASGERAVELARNALDAGDTDVAVLYLINGANHNPAGMHILESLAAAARDSKRADLIDRATAVLELSAFQVAPDRVAEVLNLISQLNATPRNTAADIPTMTPEQSQSEADAMLAKHDPLLIWDKRDSLASAIAELASLALTIEASQAEPDDPRYGTALESVVFRRGILERLQAVNGEFDHVSRCLDLMRQEVGRDAPDSQVFASVSASAQSVIAQLWGVARDLPDVGQEALRRLAKDCADSENALKEKLSVGPLDDLRQKAAAMVSARATLETQLNNGTGAITPCLSEHGRVMEYFGTHLDTLLTPESRDHALSSLREVRSSAVGLESLRRLKYNQWAIGCVNGFMAEWNKHNIVTDGEAKAMFHRYDVAQVDEMLITHEVSRVLARVMTCMTGELPATEASQIEYEMASTKKRSLEDF